jgi:hypothetical protein
MDYKLSTSTVFSYDPVEKRLVFFKHAEDADTSVFELEGELAEDINTLFSDQKSWLEIRDQIQQNPTMGLEEKKIKLAELDLIIQTLLNSQFLVSQDLPTKPAEPAALPLIGRFFALASITNLVFAEEGFPCGFEGQTYCVDATFYLCGYYGSPLGLTYSAAGTC